MVLGEENPVYGPFFGVMGAAAAIIFSGELSILRRRKKSKMEELCNFFIFGRKFRTSLLNPLLLMILFFLHSSRRCIRNRQVRDRYRCHECHETWTDYEIHHPRCHGWYYCDLRTRRRCPDCWSSRRTFKIFTLQVSNAFLRFFIVSLSSHVTDEKINEITAHYNLCVFGTMWWSEIMFECCARIVKPWKFIFGGGNLKEIPSWRDDLIKQCHREKIESW